MSFSPDADYALRANLRRCTALRSCEDQGWWHANEVKMRSTPVGRLWGTCDTKQPILVSRNAPAPGDHSSTSKTCYATMGKVLSEQDDLSLICFSHLTGTIFSSDRAALCPKIQRPQLPAIPQNPLKWRSSRYTIRVVCKASHRQEACRVRCRHVGKCCSRRFLRRHSDRPMSLSS